MTLFMALNKPLFKIGFLLTPLVLMRSRRGPKGLANASASPLGLLILQCEFINSYLFIVFILDF
jgi:hypothetical protein